MVLVLVVVVVVVVLLVVGGGMMCACQGWYVALVIMSYSGERGGVSVY
jgi:hypothetical protein